MADTDSYKLDFVDPDIASLRVPIYLNADGEIAIDGDTIAGSKNFTFTYTKYNATAQELYHGTTEAIAVSNSTTGIISTFIEYLLGSTTDSLGIKRTIVQTTRETSGNTPPNSVD